MTQFYVGGHAARSERYMRDHWAHAKGFIDDAQLATSARQEESDHVAAQQAAGLDLLSPAYTRWEDLFRFLGKEGAPVQPGRLTRTFETNTFHRQPQLSGPLPPAHADALATFQLPAGAPWVLTLPSPWDFACRSHDLQARAPGAVAAEVGTALRPLVDEAVRRGAKLIRFHDPMALYARAPQPPTEAFAAALANAAGRHRELCTLHLTNGDAAARPAVLEANPLGGLSIEAASPPPRVALDNRVRLSVGTIEGQESLIEDPARILRDAEETARRLGLALWGITNGWDLEHVPHAIALRKLAALGAARRTVAVAA